MSSQRPPIRDVYENADEIRELQAYMPRRPYCANAFGAGQGLCIRAQKEALTYRNIQLNPPFMITFLTFDFDYDAGIDYRVNAPLVVIDNDLCLPFWYVINPKNGHSHIIYVLKTPVLTTSAAHTKPLRYLEDIRYAMTEKMRADPAYNGLTSKNPFCPYWKVYVCSPRPVSLMDLALRVGLEGSVEDRRRYGYLPANAHSRAREDVSGLGRNCAIFERVRFWSYRAIREYWGKGYTEWVSAVKYRCRQENAEFPTPLCDVELKQIAKSIARWTWKRITPEGFSEKQRNTIKRRWAKASKREVGIALLNDGCAPEEIAIELEVTDRTVRNWARAAGVTRESLLPPGYMGSYGKRLLVETEGISRATYYRRLKSGGIV